MAQVIELLPQQIQEVLTDINNALGLGGGGEGFTNDFHVNQTCMFLIVLYVFLFLYKKEVMAMVNKFLK